MRDHSWGRFFWPAFIGTEAVLAVDLTIDGNSLQRTKASIAIQIGQRLQHTLVTTAS
jgi:hypothetical protein